MLKPLFYLLYFFVSVQFQNSSLESFNGEWNGTGNLYGNEARFKMTWEPTLDGEFIELNFENGLLRDGEYQRIVAAKAIYWFIDDSHLEGHWYDTRGFILPLEATFENNTLTTLWGDEHSPEQGKTIYRLTKDGEFEVEDYVLKNGVMTEFGKATYKKNR